MGVPQMLQYRVKILLILRGQFKQFITEAVLTLKWTYYWFYDGDNATESFSVCEVKNLDNGKAA
jgi:hypothetical protein